MTLAHALFAPTALALAAGAAQATEIRVPRDFPAIQQAIDASRDGDVVRVSPGTYFEHIDFHGHDITVLSEDGAADTVIDGSGSGRVVVFQSGETRGATISGFTIQHGAADDQGGGVFISNASPRVINSLIQFNAACNGGGIAATNGARPRISGNRIQLNASNCAGGYGGGLDVNTTGLAEVEANRFEHNQATTGGGIAVRAPLFAKPVIARNVLEQNSAIERGGAIYLEASHVRVISNLIVHNGATQGGGIYASAADHFYHPTIVNNTLADNFGGDLHAWARLGGTVGIVNTIVRTSEGAHGIVCDLDRRSRALFYNALVYAINGATVDGPCGFTDSLLDVDPQFLDTHEHTYWLQPTSPAIDAGVNVTSKIHQDLSGVPRVIGPAVDIGAYEYRQP